MQLSTSEHEELRATCRKLLSRNATSERIREVSNSPTGEDDAFWKQIADLGWTTITIPEEYEGIGQGLVELAILAEEFGRSLQPSPIVPSSVATWVIQRHGTEGLRSQLLPQLASAEAIATWGLQGPGDNGPLTISSGRISGRRLYVPEAHRASHLAVDAQLDGKRVLAVVDTNGEGVTIERQHTLDLTRRYFAVAFDSTPITGDGLILSDDAHSDLFRAGVVLQCAESVGIARRLLDMTVDYVSTRRQFDRPIGSFQAIKHRIADMYIQLEGSVVATEEAAWAVEHRRSDADVSVHVAKSWTGRSASAIASDSLQLHGGIAFTWEHDLHLFLRRAKVNELLLGTPAWHDEQLFRALAAGTA
ncbi:acyl-CoA dehydrogenase family protein [Rhodococcus sp. NPDC059968]|uniref:acyl-CoA dehydrogenase family protein n=1 Tax=Rhodococcus sp. NPDC059968 TaxID=3347017 RepID=UPI00366B044A